MHDLVRIMLTQPMRIIDRRQLDFTGMDTEARI
jgi:hypothetical protein